MFLATFNVFTLPMDVAFQPDSMKGATFTVLNGLVDFCFLLDIIFTFRTTFVDQKTGDEIYDMWKIARIYLKGQFTIDLLSTVPLD